MIFVAMIVGVAILIYISRIVIGVTYPVHSLAKQILIDRLKEFSIDPRFFSDQCLDELCNFATSPMMNLRGSIRQNLRDNVESIALNVAGICFGDGEGALAKIKAGVENGRPDVYWQILAKHDPKRFSLEGLEKTQLFCGAVKQT